MVGARVRGGGGDGGLGIVVRGLQLVQTLLNLSCEIFIVHYCQPSLIGSCRKEQTKYISGKSITLIKTNLEQTETEMIRERQKNGNLQKNWIFGKHSLR